MNREIKFKRAYFRDEEKTKFSHFSDWGVNIDNACFSSPSSNNFAMFFIDIQFTGLKDSKGNDIYEGDILKYSVLDLYEENQTEYTEEVFWVDGCFMLDGCPLYSFSSIGEVIGNIYQNTELLNP